MGKKIRWSVWYGSSYTVEAETEEEALEKGQSLFEADTRVDCGVDVSEMTDEEFKSISDKQNKTMFDKKKLEEKENGKEN